MHYKKSSWSDELDPAFPEFIKLYLEFLKVSELPDTKGYLCLFPSDKNYKTLELEGFPGMAPFYECDTQEDSAIDFGLVLGVPQIKEGIKKAKHELKKKEGFYNNLSSLFELMEDESRDYYKKAFEHLRSEKVYRAYLSQLSEQENKAWHKKTKGNMDSFHWHGVTMLIEIQKAEITEVQKRLKSFNPSSRLIRRNLFYIWNTVSLLVNKKPLKELFIEARKGNDEALFKLIKVDKTLFGFDWVQARINKAIYSGDYKFLESLGKAIQTDPLKNRKKTEPHFLVLLNFWNTGLYRLTIPQIVELLQDSGMAIPDDNEILRKFIDREIKPFFK